MADISQIRLPSGTVYDIKDAVARQAVAGGITFQGITTTALTDGSTATSYVIDGVSRDSENGDFVVYGKKEFIYSSSDEKWHELGDNSAFKALAYKDTATGNYTPTGTVSKPTFTGSSSSVTITATDNANGNYQPKGTVSQPTFTGNALTSTGSVTPQGSVSVSVKTSSSTNVEVETTTGTANYTPAGSVSAPTISVATAGSTTTVKNPTSKEVVDGVSAVAPGSTAPSNNLVYYDVSGEVLSLYQIGYTKSASITTSNVTVKTGDASYSASTPTFTGTGARLRTKAISVPATFDATFTGSSSSVSVSGTPSGSVSQPTFTGTKAQISGTTTPSGTVSQPTFTGTQGSVTVS